MEDIRALVQGVELLSLDAGNTVIFLDHTRVARLLASEGFAVEPARLIETEGEAKRRQEGKTLLQVPWAHEGAPGARGWGQMVGTFVHLGGVPMSELPRVLEKLWAEHVARNLWSLVPEGLVPALRRVRDKGCKVVVVSNSEGMLDVLFRELGLGEAFDLVVDSGKVGVEKPDPRIFRCALEPYGVGAERALHLGDSYATDVLGARAAGLRCALIDPFGHWRGLHADVPRVASVMAAADAWAALSAAFARP